MIYSSSKGPESKNWVKGLVSLLASNYLVLPRKTPLGGRECWPDNTGKGLEIALQIWD